MSTNNGSIKFSCIVAKQPIGEIYVGVMNCDDLEKITEADVRRLKGENRDVEDYIGIQRKLDNKRTKEIGKYVNLIDATFPNSVILAISSEHLKYNPEKGVMEIEYKDDIAKVLDGQHRIAGLKHFNESGDNFQIVVSIFVDMEVEDQALIFATINKEQKNVSNSLVADLFDFAKTRSPQKTCHNIARALNAKESSPFYKKIKILGNAVNPTESISQDTFVKSLIQYVTKDAHADRDFYKRNKDNKKAKLPLVSGTEEQRLFLRNMFIDDDTDTSIAQLIWNYFYAVQKKWPNDWNEARPNNILNKSTGFIALMKFFKDVYLSFNVKNEVIPKEMFVSVFDRVSIDEGSFTKDRYIPGTKGQSVLYNELKLKSGIG